MAATRTRAHVPAAVQDTALAAAVAFAMVLAVSVAGEPNSRPPDARAYALAVAVGIVLLVRRRWPLPVLLATWALIAAYHILDYPAIGLAAPLAAALYNAAVSGYQRWAVLVAVVPFVTGGVWRGFVEREPLLELLSDGVREAALLASMLLLGEALRTRRAWLAEVRERLRRVEADREREADRRVTEERLRIARELHDVMAHTVAVITVQAGVASDVLDENPAEARSALAAIRAASREATAELKSTLGVLRGDDTALRAPGLAQVSGLVDAARAAGLRVDVAVEGHPRALPAAVETTAYRVLQESLTNVLLHAQATAACVAIAYQPRALVVGVEDDGHGGRNRPGRSGHGLAGMRERVEAMGGALEAGPRDGGGFRVRARLPDEDPR